MSRQIVLDTETTGLEPSQGHRVIEIGCVELINRRLTGNNYHQYLQPDREIDEGALQVHGISNEFLKDKPRFNDIVDDLMNYLKGAELVIHNAPFDVSFLDHELKLSGEQYGLINEHCTVIDTLVMARKMHPGQKNNLDALCKRYDVNNSQRDLHGALLDAEILSDVYLRMTGGQVGLALDSEQSVNREGGDKKAARISSDRAPLKVIPASQDELAAHAEFLQKMGDACLWNESNQERGARNE
jgi:DNA polymerase-3 subunit epsilon